MQHQQVKSCFENNKMGKRRNTAKTGDKALYKGREASSRKNDTRTSLDDDPMYDEVDRYHNEKERDYLRLDGVAADSSDEDDDANVEAVMDLGVDNDYSDDDRLSNAVQSKGIGSGRKAMSEDPVLSDDDDDDVDDEEEEDDDEEEAISSSDDDDDNDEEENVRAWGSKKSSYYSGGAADLDDDNDEENLYLEEKAAKEVQALRFKDMSEDDFILSDGEEDEDDAAAANNNDVLGIATTITKSKKDITKLSSREKCKLLNKNHPEMLPLLRHFTPIVEEVVNHTGVATRAVFESQEGTAETIGATILGQQYLLTKTLLQSTAALNLSMYLLLKLNYHSATKEKDNDKILDDSVDLIQSHPVMVRLQKINTIMQELETNVEDKVDGLREQVGNIVKAAALLESNEISVSEEEDNDDVNENEDTSIDNTKRPIHDNNDDDDESIEEEASDDDDDDDDAIVVDEKEDRRNALIEARYGLRPIELSNKTTRNDKLGRNKNHSLLVDAGDDDDNDDEEEKDTMERIRRRKESMKALASTVNTIEQRVQSRIRRSAPIPEQLDGHEEDDGELKRGLDMMEAELAGKISDEEDEGEMDDDDDDIMENEFYKQISTKSKTRKDERHERYKVQPKFPSMEKEVVGERAITRQILKNRGLVAHKNKLNRNPRVKKREQYRKALIRRRGTIRDIRDKSIEGHQYGGEATGIKTHLSRSRKLDR